MGDSLSPPTQSVGGAGFEADLYASDIKKSTGSYGHCGNVMEGLMGYVQDRIQSYGERNFYDEYVKWHDAKGYWKNENVYGELVEVK